MTTQPLEKTSKQARLYDPYKVLLHNDDKNEMDHVVASISKAVPTISSEQAHAIMLEAHESGVALVIACPLEHAELYCDRLRSFGLTSSIEKGD